MFSLFYYPPLFVAFTALLDPIPNTGKTSGKVVVGGKGEEKGGLGG